MCVHSQTHSQLGVLQLQLSPWGNPTSQVMTSVTRHQHSVAICPLFVPVAPTKGPCPGQWCVLCPSLPLSRSRASLL